MKWISALALASLFYYNAPALAQAKPEPPQEEEEALVTDRPDFTESSDTVPARRYQLEGGYTFNRNGATTTHTLGELLLRGGLNNRLEFRFALNSLAILEGGGASASGWQDMTLGVKWKLREASRKKGFGIPQTALIGQFFLPSGHSSVREPNVQPQLKLCLGWDLSEKLSMSSNINYTYASLGGSQFSQVAASLSFGYEVSKRVGSYLEFFTFAPGSYKGSDTHYLNGGLTYLVNNNLQLDARLGVGMNGVRDDFFFGLGVSRRW